MEFKSKAEELNHYECLDFVKKLIKRVENGDFILKEASWEAEVGHNNFGDHAVSYDDRFLTGKSWLNVTLKDVKDESRINGKIK